MDGFVFVLGLIAAFSAGLTGLIFQPGTWYQGLNKPNWTPPNRAFPIIWSVLYVVMAIVLGILAARGATTLMALWALQMVLNTLWSPVFFGAHRIKTGLYVIGGLWIVLVLLTLGAFGVSALAGVLMLAYLAWVSVAFALNHYIWKHNPA